MFCNSLPNIETKKIKIVFSNNKLTIKRSNFSNSFIKSCYLFLKNFEAKLYYKYLFVKCSSLGS